MDEDRFYDAIMLAASDLQITLAHRFGDGRAERALRDLVHLLTVREQELEKTINQQQREIVKQELKIERYETALDQVHTLSNWERIVDGIESEVDNELLNR